MLGVDVSRWQTPPLPWAAWVAGGLEICVTQVTHGTAPEPHAAEHLAGAAAANVPHVGVYHYLLPGNGAAQAAAFLANSPGWIEFSALDVEEPGLTAADVLDFCAAYDAATHRPLVLYGNYSGLVGILNAHPELKRYPVWWAQYSSKMTPPADLHVIGWQKLGSEPGFIGHLEPYPNPIDITDWFELPSPLPSKTTDLPLPAEGVELMPDFTKTQLAVNQAMLALTQANAAIVAAQEDLADAQAALNTPAPLPSSVPWWEKLPAGLITPPQPYPPQPKEYAIVDQSGIAVAGVKPRMNAGVFFERRANLLRVTDAPVTAGGPLWWVRGESITTSLGPVG